MAAAIDDPTAVHHQHLVEARERREPMGDYHDAATRPPAQHRAQHGVGMSRVETLGGLAPNAANQCATADRAGRPA
ncbi:MAG: hypothetical protein L0H64_00490 [Pseudonocardia sp.]|nr:hypothetical protein [Pseudonocardia sp.]